MKTLVECRNKAIGSNMAFLVVTLIVGFEVHKVYSHEMRIGSVYTNSRGCHFPLYFVIMCINRVFV